MPWPLIFLIASIVFLFYVWSKRPKNFPPGPWSLPVVGSLASVALISGDTPQDKLWNLCRKYGQITGIVMGTKPVVVVSGYEMSKYVLSKDEFSFRPSIISVTSRSYNQRLGVIFNDGSDWKEQRRFTLRHLRDLGLGRRSMEALIHEEARALIQFLDKACEQPHVDILPTLPVHSINILWTIMAGKRHEVDDQEFLKLTEAVMDFFRNGNPLSIANNYPNLQMLPIIGDTFKRQLKDVEEIQAYLQVTIKEHMKDFDENYIRDFIDAYIREMKTQTDKKTSFSSEQLCILCFDLFIAGTETTSGTLAYAMRYMLQYPHIQHAVREEIMREVGAQRLPGMEDMNNMHYTQAVISEVLRHSGLVPFTAPHVTAGETDLFGYTLPTDTPVLVNLWSVHMDSEIWGDPENFRPERFIDENGIFHKNEHTLFFGAGPRMCLGEPLARFSTFILFTAIIQQFEFKSPANTPPPSNQQLQGLTTSPTPYLLAVKKTK